MKEVSGTVSVGCKPPLRELVDAVVNATKIAYSPVREAVNIAVLIGRIAGSGS